MYFGTRKNFVTGSLAQTPCAMLTNVCLVRKSARAKEAEPERRPWPMSRANEQEDRDDQVTEFGSDGYQAKEYATNTRRWHAGSRALRLTSRGERSTDEFRSEIPFRGVIERESVNEDSSKNPHRPETSETRPRAMTHISGASQPARVAILNKLLNRDDGTPY